MDTDRPCHLGDADDRLLDVPGRHHHQVIELVDDDHDERQPLGRTGLVLVALFFFVLLFLFLGLGAVPAGPFGHFDEPTLEVSRRARSGADGTGVERVVVAGYVPHAVLGEEVVPVLHLLDRPREGVRSLLRIDHDGGQEVRQAVVVPELDPLRVDQDHADLVRGGTEQDRGDERVDARRLAGAGGTRDEHVRHVGQVDHDGAARDVTTERHIERVAGVAGLVGGQDVAQRDELALVVRHLDPDGRLAGDRGQDADVG